MNIKMSSIPEENPIKASKFYTTILDFKELMHMREAFLFIVVSPDNKKGTALLLEPVDDKLYKPFQREVYDKGLPIIILGSKDIEKENNRLLKLNVICKTPPTKTNYGTLAVFDDTCDNYIQIHQVL